MKNKTIVVKCDNFGHNVVIDRATAMWIGSGAVDRQVTLNPEQMLSTFYYNHVFYIDWVNRDGDYNEYFFVNVIELPTS